MEGIVKFDYITMHKNKKNWPMNLLRCNCSSCQENKVKEEGTDNKFEVSKNQKKGLYYTLFKGWFW